MPLTRDLVLMTKPSPVSRVNGVTRSRVNGITHKGFDIETKEWESGYSSYIYRILNKLYLTILATITLISISSCSKYNRPKTAVE